MIELVAGVLLSVVGIIPLFVSQWHEMDPDTLIDPWGWLNRNRWQLPMLLTGALLFLAGIALIYRGWDSVF